MNVLTINTDKSYGTPVFVTNQLWGDYMVKKCFICGKNKNRDLFYRGHKNCIECWNMSRRNSYKKSICRHCKVEFRPGEKGRYKFCSEKCRFMDKVKIDPVSGCWIWQASLNRTGYGTFVPIGKRSGLAHRASYRIFKRELPTEKLKFILHSCHRYNCVAPDHLRIGTPLDNTIDRQLYGRTTKHGKKKGIT